MTEIEQLEREIYEKAQKLIALRRAAPAEPVRDYPFETIDGPTSLLKLFGDKSTLLAIHNMGQGCRYCTLWADGLNAFLPHLESRFAVVLLSKDPPAAQRAMANARGWRFRTASHGGGAYIREQSLVPGHDNQPGVVCYVREGDRIFRKNAAQFGPGDLYCPVWHLLGLAGVGKDGWTPQFTYWKRPSELEDGGQDVRD